MCLFLSPLNPLSPSTGDNGGHAPVLSNANEEHGGVLQTASTTGEIVTNLGNNERSSGDAEVRLGVSANNVGKAMALPTTHDEEETGASVSSLGLNINNLYSPFYYGDSHIEVGHPFAITCIVMRTEPIHWEKDGDIIDTGLAQAYSGSGGNEGKLKRSTHGRQALRGGVEVVLSKGIGGRVPRAAGYQNENLINWAVEMRPSTIQSPLEQDRDSLRFMENGLEDDRVADFMTAASDSGDESVSVLEDENDVAAVENGRLNSRLRLDHGSGMQEERIKRNGSELEKFNLSRYYKAVVDFYNMGGGRSYYADSFLTDETMELEQQPQAEEERSKAVHDYIFTQGHVQGTLISHGD